MMMMMMQNKLEKEKRLLVTILWYFLSYNYGGTGTIYVVPYKASFGDKPHFIPPKGTITKNNMKDIYVRTVHIISVNKL